MVVCGESRSTSGSRGVIWRPNPRGTQKLLLKDGRRERGDWWIRWACPHGHLHRALAGPKSVATEEVQRKRVERPCPRHQVRKVNHLLADVIREYLAAAEMAKRSFRNDKRYGESWTERLGNRTGRPSAWCSATPTCRLGISGRRSSGS